MIPARIAGTGVALPRRRMDTVPMLAQAMPDRDPERMAAKLGIRTRWWIDEGESTGSLAAAALGDALAEAGLSARDLRRLVLVNQTGGDQMIPSTANNVMERLGNEDCCDAFDLHNACTGFLTALDLAARAVATGEGPIGVVAADVFSRELTPEKPREWLVFGDAAAAAVVVPSRSGGLVASHLRNNGALRGRVGTPRPGPGSHHTLAASADELAANALHWVGTAATAALAAAGTTMPELRWVLPHQPNGAMFRALAAAIGARPDQLAPVVEDIGSVGCVSVPYSLHHARRAGVRPGDRLLLAAVGAGTSYGALVWEEGGP